MNKVDRPIVFFSVMKSGTVMVRRIIQDLTGLPCVGPAGKPGISFQDPAQFFHVPGSFYSWHLFPVAEVREQIVATGARPILLMRNVYDLVVSIYYHFANNVDLEIGKGRNVDHYFREISKDEGLTRIILGMEKPDFRWRGVGQHYYQMELMLQLAEEHPCFVTTYERMTASKAEEVARLATFLEIPLDSAILSTVLHHSQFDVMKGSAAAHSTGSSHFRLGRCGCHASELREEHVQLVQQTLAKQAPNLPALLARADLPEILALQPLDDG